MEVVEAGFWIPFLMAASAVYSGASQAMAAQASAKAAQDAADYNADIAMKRAEAEAGQATASAKQMTRQQRDIIGKQVASIGSRGGLEAGGDIMQVQTQSSKMAADALNQMYAGNLAMTRGINQAQSAQYQGELEKTKAKWTERAGYVSAVTGGLTGWYAGKDMMKDPTQGAV